MDVRAADDATSGRSVCRLLQGFFLFSVMVFGAFWIVVMLLSPHVQCFGKSLFERITKSCSVSHDV